MVLVFSLCTTTHENENFLDVLHIFLVGGHGIVLLKNQYCIDKNV